MKISYNWLKDYVEIKLAPQALAEKLTMAGLEVTAIEKIEDDFIFEIEVTSNRADCLSIKGVAREIAAITKSKVKSQKSKVQFKIQNLKKEKGSLKINIENKKDCPLYTAKVIRDVKVGPSPEWLQKKIKAVGLRPVNNVVDITNYVLFETGQPLHAFDLDKIPENKIIIRRAADNETITTIDGNTRNLNQEILVIADSQKPIAVAGIMGGLNTEVTSSTKNILLESAYFDAVRIRRGSRILGISTDSSYRFERGVDVPTVEAASWRTVELILKICGGNLSEVKDCGAAPKEKGGAIALNISKVNEILNLKIPASTIKKILVSLGFKVKTEGAKTFKVFAPSLRPDVKIEADLIEEISRIYGFAKIPTSIPHIRPDISPNIPDILKLENKVRQILLEQGLNEAITYSLIGKDLLEKADFSFHALTYIENPLSIDQEILRPTLLPMLLNAVVYNLNHQQESVNLFEIGKIFLNEQEKLALGIIMAGKNEDFCLPGAKVNLQINIANLKGVVETLLENLGIEDFKISPENYNFFTHGAAAKIKIKDKEIGILGEIKEKTLSEFSLKAQKEVFFAEILLEDLLARIKFKKTFAPLNLYPSIYRDISLIIDKTISFNRIENLLFEKGEPYLKEIRIIDYYRGEQIPADKTGLTLSLRFQAQDKTLKDEEVNSLKEKICQALSETLGAKIR